MLLLGCMKFTIAIFLYLSLFAKMNVCAFSALISQLTLKVWIITSPVFCLCVCYQRASAVFLTDAIDQLLTNLESLEHTGAYPKWQTNAVCVYVCPYP